MLDRGLSSLGLTLSQNKSIVVASHPRLLRADRRELLEQAISFEGGSSVRDVGLGAQEIGQNPNQERAEVSPKKRSYQSHTKRFETQTRDTAGVQNGGSCHLWLTGTLEWVCALALFNTRGLWLLIRVAGGTRPLALRQSYIFIFGETGDPAIWFPLDQLRTWLELQGEDVGHRLEKIDIARAWAAASANMRKRSRWSMVVGPVTAMMAARSQHHPSLTVDTVPRRRLDLHRR